MTPPVRATLLACLFFAGFGCLIPFLPLWLEKVHGFTGTQIGVLLAIGGFSRVVVGPITAAWADGQADRRAPLFMFAAILAIGMAVLFVTDGFLAVFTLVLVLDVAFWGLLPVVETALLRLTKQGGPSYGLARGLASLFFVFGTTAVGILTDRFGYWSIWAWLFGIAALLCLAAALMPREAILEGREAPFAKRLAAGLGMTRDPAFVLFIASAGLIQATHSFYYVAGTLIWTNVQGLSGTATGMLWNIGVAAEVLFLIALANWSDKFRPETLIVAGGVAAVIRWSALAMLPPFWVLVPLQLLHAGTFAATFLGGIRLINRMFGDARTPTAQMMYMALASAPAQAVATLASGPLYDRYGAIGYLGMTAVSVVGLGLAVLLWRRSLAAAASRPAAA